MAPQDAARKQLSSLQKHIEDLRTDRIGNPVANPPREADELASATSITSLQQADADLGKLIDLENRKTQKLALVFSVPISLVVALAGIRALNSFLPTAGLLAGGADGLHKILDRFITLASGEARPKPERGGTAVAPSPGRYST